MATHWTYDATLFSSTIVGYYIGSTVGERYQVRLLIQDINTSRQLFQDEEVDWQLTQEANVYMAAALLCDVLVMRAGGIKSKKISEFAVQYDTKFYMSLAGELRARGMGHQVPYAGGISISDKARQEGDTDAVPPKITRRQADNPAAPQPSVTPTNPLETI